MDVGPILFPDFASTEDMIVDRIQLAYVLYNQLDEVEFAIREPTMVIDGQSAETLHYSNVVKTAARSEIVQPVELRSRHRTRPSSERPRRVKSLSPSRHQLFIAPSR